MGLSVPSAGSMRKLEMVAEASVASLAAYRRRWPAVGKERARKDGRRVGATRVGDVSWPMAGSKRAGRKEGPGEAGQRGGRRGVGGRRAPGARAERGGGSPRGRPQLAR